MPKLELIHQWQHFKRQHFKCHCFFTQKDICGLTSLELTFVDMALNIEANVSYSQESWKVVILQKILFTPKYNAKCESFAPCLWFSNECKKLLNSLVTHNLSTNHLVIDSVLGVNTLKTNEQIYKNSKNEGVRVVSGTTYLVTTLPTIW